MLVSFIKWFTSRIVLKDKIYIQNAMPRLTTFESIVPERLLIDLEHTIH